MSGEATSSSPKATGGVAEGAADGRVPTATVYMPPLPARRSETWPTPPSPPAPPVEMRVTVPEPPRAKAVRRRSRWPLFSFLAMVVAPTLVAAVYFLFIASDQYTAEFRFSVMQASSPGTPGGGGSAVAALAGLSGMGGVSSAASQNYVVADYLRSRAATDALDRQLRLRQSYAREDIDPLSRFAPGGGADDFARYWRRMVKTKYDPVTGIATARVKAFEPGEALRIAQAMSVLAEGLINEINGRIDRDALTAAEEELKRAEARFQAGRGELSAFRRRSGVVDPSTSSVPINTELNSQLRQQLVGLQAQQQSLRAQGLSAEAPAVQALATQIAAVQQQLGQVRGEVAGGSRALTGMVDDYERLTVDNGYAQAALMSALQARDRARANASSQQLFLTPFVAPSLPDAPSEPRRGLMIVLTAVAAFGAWLLALLLYRSVNDHAF